MVGFLDWMGRKFGTTDNPVIVTMGAGGAAGAPRAGTLSAVAVGGTAVIAVAGPIAGGYLVNPYTLEQQGIAAAENLYVDPVVAPGSTDAAAVGTTSVLTPGQGIAIPALPTGSSFYVNAATSGHKFNIVVW